MSKYDAVLVRWSQGDAYVGSGGRELFVKNTGLHSEKQARALGTELLNVVNAEVTSRAIEGEAYTGDHTPNVGWTIGDRIDGELVTGFTVRMDEQGSSVVPTLVDPDVLRAAALDRRLAALAQGQASQWSQPAGSRRTDPTGKDNGSPEWSYSGDLLHNTFSPLWRVRRAFNLTWLDATVRKPSAGGGVGASVYLTAYKVNRAGTVQTGLGNVGIAATKRRGVAKVGNLIVPAGWSIIFGMLLGGGSDPDDDGYAPVDLTITAHGVAV